MMAEETKFKSERPETRPSDGKPDTGSTGRGNNQNLNQRFRKTTEKFFGRTKAICGHIFDITLFGKSNCENISNEFQIHFETHFLLLETLLNRN